MTRHSHQLREVLKMQNNQTLYNSMRAEMTKIHRKHMDYESPFSLQKEAVKAMINELEDRWPDFFSPTEENGKIVGKHALRYLMQHHSYVRSKLKSKATLPAVPEVSRKITTNVQAKQELPTSQGLSSSASTQIPLAERMTHNLEFYSGNVPTLSQIESSGPKTLAPSEPNRRARPSVVLPVTSKLRPGNGITEGVAKTSTILSPSSVNNIQRTAQHPLSQESTMPTSISFCHDNKASPPQPYPSQSMSTSFPNAPPQQINARAIQHFLQTCLPPMDHLLHHFVDAGLRTEEGLLAASRWPRELIESFLDQLPPLPDGSPVLLMDKIVLMHQFATYFL